METTLTAVIPKGGLHAPPPQQSAGRSDDASTSTRSTRTSDDTDHRWRPDGPVDRYATEICVGSRHLAPSGRIWTVHRVLSRSGRFLLESSSADGDVAAVMDRNALERMISLDSSVR